MGRTKALERRYAEHLATKLKPFVDERFGGNQTRAAEAMGISQSHLSQILAGDGAGIAVLIKVRAYTRWSLEDLLGLESFKGPAPNTQLPAELPDGKRVLELLKATVAAMEQSEPPPPPPKKPADPVPVELPRLRPRRRP